MHQSDLRSGSGRAANSVPRRPVEESDEDRPGVILDYDKDGNVVASEVLNASQRVEDPRGVDYAVTQY